MKLKRKVSSVYDSTVRWGPNLKTFVYWINERQRIYARRLKYPSKPVKWTDDGILKQFRFCNVYRELDRVTIWIRENWSYKVDTPEGYWFSHCVARQINNIETLEAIGVPECSKRWVRKAKKIMHDRMASGHKVYGSAYIITAGGKAVPKIDYTCDYVLAELVKFKKHISRDILRATSLQDIWEVLLRHQGFGKFIAYEVVSDLRWTPLGSDATDKLTWANAGPGAKRGLNRLLGRDLRTKMKDEECLSLMRLLHKTVVIQLDPVHEQAGLPFEMREVEHSLCETDKYIRVETGEGRMKCKFVPASLK